MDVGATRRGYDAVAGDYAAAISDELAGKPLDRALLDVVVEAATGAPVLDVGCGPGHVTAALAARGGAALGSDLSPAMCDVAARTTGLRFVAADMTALPIASATLGAIVCLYAVIHLDPADRADAYREFARTLRRGGQALVAFHTGAADVPADGRVPLTSWWGHDVDLVFRYLDPAPEIAALAAAGLTVRARLEREPYDGVEHASRRCYLLARRD